MLDVFKIEEDKRYGLHSGTYQYNKARVESMSNRIEELEAHLEILEKQPTILRMPTAKVCLRMLLTDPIFLMRK